MVLKIGIFLKRSFTTCKIFLPMNDKERPPMKVMNIIDNIISKPGIEKGK